MKKTALIAGVTIATTLSSQAAVISFTGMSLGGGTLSAGTFTPDPTGTTGSFTSLSYTVTGLTIDMDGTLDDSITVSFAVTGTGGATAHVLDWDGTEIDIGGAQFGTGDVISFGNIGVTGVLSGGETLQVNSATYTSLSLRRWHDGDAATIAGSSTTGNHAFADGSSIALGDTAFSLAHSTGVFNLTTFGFSVDVEAVPEPTSTALLGLGGLALLTRRGRK